VPHRFIAELKEGDKVRQYFLLRQAERRTDKSGKPFLTLFLGDRTGIITAQVWSEVLRRCPGPFTTGDFVGVRGLVTSYRGELQLTVENLVRVDDLLAQGKELGDFDPELLHLATAFDRRQLWQELRDLAAAHLETPLQELVLHLLEQHREQLLVAPAARLYHHPYLGGLLEHTWTVARLALQALEIYPHLHRGLVVAGAMLHDLGKLKELANPATPELTVPGALLGHIVLGWEMVREAAQTLALGDSPLLLELEHIVLSHHGSLEFGSPVPPKTPEALLVSMLDDLDAKLKMMDQHLKSEAGDGAFTAYHRVLQRDLYRGRERDAAPLPPEDDDL